MKLPLSCAGIRSAIRLTFLLFFASAAWSQCNNPSSPGVVICTPSNDSTVVYLNELSVRATPASGATISLISLYNNGVRIYQTAKGETGIDLYDAAIYNGQHDIVAKAWDSEGNLYEARTNFSVTGEGYAPCPVPNSSGIIICNPPAGSVYSTGVTVDASAKGKSAITNMSFYVNGTLVNSVTNNDSAGVPIQLGAQGSSNALTVTATDSSGNQYTAHKTLVPEYTYGQYSCSQTCPPGINIVAPQSGAYVASTFNLDMQIVGNSKPITAMKAYIDNNVVATSSGANLQQEITDAPNGTHILTVQGWDDEGTEYRIQENININIDE